MIIAEIRDLGVPEGEADLGIVLEDLCKRFNLRIGKQNLQETSIVFWVLEPYDSLTAMRSHFEWEKIDGKVSIYIQDDIELSFKYPPTSSFDIMNNPNSFESFVESNRKYIQSQVSQVSKTHHRIHANGFVYTDITQDRGLKAEEKRRFFDVRTQILTLIELAQENLLLLKEDVLSRPIETWSNDNQFLSISLQSIDDASYKSKILYRMIKEE